MNVSKGILLLHTLKILLIAFHIVRNQNPTISDVDELGTTHMWCRHYQTDQWLRTTDEIDTPPALPKGQQV